MALLRYNLVSNGWAKETGLEMQTELDRRRVIKLVKPIDQEIEELVALVRDANERIGEVEEEVRPVIEAAKDRLKMLLNYRGESWSDEDGYARLVSEGTRVTYDARALDRLIASDPEQYGWLRDYRTETTIRGGVSIK